MKPYHFLHKLIFLNTYHKKNIIKNYLPQKSHNPFHTYKPLRTVSTNFTLKYTNFKQKKHTSKETKYKFPQQNK